MDCPSPKFWDFDEKRLHWASLVRGSRLSLLMRDVTKKFLARLGFAQKWCKIILEKHFPYLFALIYFFIGYFYSLFCQTTPKMHGNKNSTVEIISFQHASYLSVLTQRQHQNEEKLENPENLSILK